MVEAHKIWPGSHQTTTLRIWDTEHVSAEESFEYYREAICSAFMPLRPELDKSHRRTFRANVMSYALKTGILNHVSARSHEVHRGRFEIAASAEDCYYLNLQISGKCRIVQNGASITLSPGKVGIFDGGTDFYLDHSACDRLEVVSLLVPKRSLNDGQDGLPEGRARELSTHPIYGALLREAVQALHVSVGRAEPNDPGRLYDAILSLAAFTANTGNETASSGSRGDAHFLRIKQAISCGCTNPDFNIASCSARVGLSVGYIRNLFTAHGCTFGESIMRERLRRAATMLADPCKAHLPVYAIAFEAGFRDASHFGRAFKKAYGQAPADWRWHFTAEADAPPQ